MTDETTMPAVPTDDPKDALDIGFAPNDPVYVNYQGQRDIEGVVKSVGYGPHQKVFVNVQIVHDGHKSNGLIVAIDPRNVDHRQ
jgi:hypothetical protein